MKINFKTFIVKYQHPTSKGFKNFTMAVEAITLEQCIQKCKDAVLGAYGSELFKEFTFNQH